MSSSVSSDQLAPLLRLPNELLIDIFQLVDRAEAICLGLTCHQLYHLLLFGKIRLRGGSSLVHDTAPPTPGMLQRRLGYHTQAFLRLLERDLPNHIRCNWCRKFHPLLEKHDGASGNPLPLLGRTERISHQGTRMGFHNPSRLCPDCGLSPPRRYPGGWHYHYLDLFAVMARVRLGPEHGLPLSTLAMSTPWFKGALLHIGQDEGHTVQQFRKLDVEPRIEPGLGLTLHITQRSHFTLGPAEVGCVELAPLVSGLAICEHTAFPLLKTNISLLFSLSKGRVKTRVPDWERLVVTHEKPGGPSTFARLDYGVRRSLYRLGRTLRVRRQPAVASESVALCLEMCYSCRTRYLLTMHAHWARNGDPESVTFELVLDVWQNLGRCAEIQDPGWVDCWYSGEQSRQKLATYRSGSTGLACATPEPVSLEAWLDAPGQSALAPESVANPRIVQEGLSLYQHTQKIIYAV